MKHLIIFAAGAAVGFALVRRGLSYVERRIRDTDLDSAWEWASEEWS